MNEIVVRKKIGEEVYINSISEEKFMSDRITVNLITPLDRDQVTKNSLVSFLLRKGCVKYPDFTLLNRKLANMYGAILDSDVSKFADMQVIEISIQYLDDRYTIDNENMANDAADLISDIVFSPNLNEKGNFNEKDIRIEKESLIDLIKGELNDKRIYAINKMASMFFEGEKYAIRKYGYLEDVEKITSEELTEAWKKLISSSRIEIMCTGRVDIENVKKVFENKLSNIDRKPVKYERSIPVDYSEYKECEEKMDIVQGKLVLGFRTGAPKSEEEKNAMRLFSAIYGGTPFSKLFLNVREKLSLCYYSSSHYERNSSLLFVDSGIEFKNRDAAQSEILHQLEEIQNGNVSDDELSSTMLMMQNAFGMVNDSLSSLEGWYLDGILDDNISTPEEFVESLAKVTKEDIIDASKKVKLTTVYFLKGEDKVEA